MHIGLGLRKVLKKVLKKALKKILLTQNCTQKSELYLSQLTNIGGDIIPWLVSQPGRSRRSPAPPSGPSEPLGGPSEPLGGRSGPLGGPSGPLGGPSGPLGGPSGPLGWPSGCDKRCRKIVFYSLYTHSLYRLFHVEGGGQ